jgi:hypothetical protein
LVRAAEELPKPNSARFREFRDSALPQLKQALFNPAPIHEDLEATLLGFTLVKVREDLGPDDPFVKRILGKDSPEELAERLIKGTKLKDVAFRKQLFEGGKKAIAASNDPLIQFAAMIEPEARAVRKKYEDEVESVIKKNGELVAKARFEVGGKVRYPDATFTPRLSYGSVKGWQEGDHFVQPLTTIGGAFDRATGRPPFQLPDSWVTAKPKLNMSTPLNIATTNDIIGGNSGSPVFNKDGEIIGLIFDGNIESLGGEYGFDERVNRAVAVASPALTEALEKVYGAERLVKELRGAK